MTKKTGRIDIERVLTTSLRNLWTGCHRRFYYRIMEGLKPIATPRPLYFGSMVHAGLAAHYDPNGVATCASAVKASAMEYIADLSNLQDADAAQGAIEETEANAREALALLTRYFDFWGASNDAWEVLAVEQMYETRLMTPRGTSSHWMFAGVFDLVVRDRGDGVIKIIDHKTTATKNREAYIADQELDPQSKGYVMLAQEALHEPVQFVFNVLRKNAPAEPAALVCKGKCNALAKEDGYNPDCPKCHGTNVTGYSVKKGVDTTPAIFEAAMKAHPHVEWTDEYHAHMERLRANADSWFYQVEPPPFNADDLHDFHQESYEVTREISEANYWTRNFNACKALGRKCVYRHLCLNEGNKGAQEEARTAFTAEPPGGAPELKRREQEPDQVVADLMAAPF